MLDPARPAQEYKAVYESPWELSYLFSLRGAHLGLFNDGGGGLHLMRFSFIAASTELKLTELHLANPMTDLRLPAQS